MNKNDIQREALEATDGKQKCSVVLGTGEIINLKK